MSLLSKQTFTLPLSFIDWVPFIALAARLLSSATADLSFLILAVYAFRGRPQTIQALALSWLFIMLNPAIAPNAALGEIGRYAVLFAGVLFIALRKRVKLGRTDSSFMIMTILLGTYFFAHSLIFSAMPDVSILKAVTWMVSMATLIAAWSGLTLDQSLLLQRWLMGFLIIILLSSLPFLAIPSVGYLTNGSGFQGILNHPQAFGLVMALFGALVLGWVLAQKHPRLKDIVLMLGCFGLIVMSEARTAGFALVFGVGFAVFSVSLLSGKPLSLLAPALRSQRFLLLIFIGFLVAVVMSSQLDEVINQFIHKGGQAQGGGLIEAYDESRGFKMDEMLENIEAQPFYGIGLGVASNPNYRYVGRDPVFGLPVKAPVEKGVMPLAVLEEVGIPGFILVGIWIMALLRHATARGVSTLSVVMVGLFLNMGEFTLFAPGGFGMLLLILFAWASAKPNEPLACSLRSVYA